MAATGALAVVAAIIPVAYIAPRYAPPPAVAEADLPANLRPVQVVFADAIELVGYSSDNDRVTPGKPVKVTFYWRALKPLERDYTLALHLLGREGTLVGSLDTWPGNGLAPTSDWAPGMILADTYFINVDETAAAPTRLMMDLYFWDDEPVISLPRRTLDGVPLPSVILAIGRALPARPEVAAPEHPLRAEFEHGLTLLGYDFSTDGALYLRLYWKLEADARVPTDYTVFVHIVDQQGIPIVEPADGPPLGGDWPTSLWEPGQVVAETRLVALPPDLHAGRYDVRLGLYDQASGVRLGARQPEGYAWPDNAVVLEDVVVK
jgi:hypothetical protein